MAGTLKGDAKSAKADCARLRLPVYDALAKQRGFARVPDQARLHGMSRSQMYRIRKGDRGISLDVALRMAEDLGTKVEVLFERVAA